MYLQRWGLPQLEPSKGYGKGCAIWSSEFVSRQRIDVFIFFKAFGWSRKPTNLLFVGYRWLLACRVKRPGHGFGYWLTYIIQLKNVWRCTSVFHTPSLTSWLFKYSGGFSFRDIPLLRVQLNVAIWWLFRVGFVAYHVALGDVLLWAFVVLPVSYRPAARILIR